MEKKKKIRVWDDHFKELLFKYTVFIVGIKRDFSRMDRKFDDAWGPFQRKRIILNKTGNWEEKKKKKQINGFQDDCN